VTARLLLDENISPFVARRLNNMDVDAYHVRDRGLTGARDDVIWRRAVEEDRVLVTINVRDFVRLAERSDVHPGVITFPSGCTRDEQFALITRALETMDKREKSGA
jgi:predicted nuclease of predicted toxin-antitoxin system